MTALGANQSRRVSLRASLAEVLGSPGRRLGFVLVAAGVGLLYTILLPFDYTQRFELANWGYLDAYLVAWSILLGLAMGLVVIVQVYAMRRVAATRASAGATGGLAFVVSMLTSCLCCTPVVPTFLAFVGVSGVGLYSATGVLQHFFAVHQTEFFASSLALLAATAWWGLRKVSRAACLTGEGGGVDGPVGNHGYPTSQAGSTTEPDSPVRV